MVGRKVVVYYAWSRPGEVEAPLEVIENRFPTLFESRHGELAAAMLGATSMSLIGTSRHFGAMRNLVAIGAKRTSTKPRQSSSTMSTCPKFRHRASSLLQFDRAD